MDINERVEILKRLEESRDVLIEAVRDVSDEMAAARRSADRWSIAECVEHVAMAERSMLALIRDGFTPREAAVDTREREAKLLRWGPNRTRRFEAPESARPSGTRSLSAAVVDFRGARGASLEYISTTGDNLRARTVEHPVAGRITAQECLMLLIVHPARHAEQIREMRE